MLDILGALNWKWTALSWDIDRDLQSQIDFFEQQWNTTVADAFRWIQNERTWVFSGFQDNLLNYYDQFEKVQNPAFQQFVKASNDQAGRVLPEIEQQAKFVREKFWPTGEIAGKANAYFQDLIKTVNQNVSWEVATAANMSQRQWGSRAWLNAAIQDARAKWLPLISQIKSQELAEKERLYSNYLALVDWLRQQRINIEDTNIKAPLLELQKQLNQLGSNIVTSMRDVDAMNIWEIQAGIANDRALWNMYAENQLQLDNIALANQAQTQIQQPVDPSIITWSAQLPDGTAWYSDAQGNLYQQKSDGNLYKFSVSWQDLISKTGNWVITSWPWNVQSPARKEWLDIDWNVWDGISSFASWTVQYVWPRWGFWNVIQVVDDSWNLHQYAHLNSYWVKVGDRVQRWQVIWSMWNTWNVYDMNWNKVTDSNRSSWSGSHLDYTVFDATTWKAKPVEVAYKFAKWQ